MAQATLTSKGQITIPKSIRDSLHLQAGDKIEFTITSDTEALITPVTRKVDEVFGILHKPGRKPISVRKMDEELKQEIRMKFN